MKKLALYILMAGCTLLFSACSFQKDDMKKLRDIDFTVVGENELPEEMKEMKEMIEEQKKDLFEITYGEKGCLYVAKGYGKQETTGYSVSVKECYETENIIYLKTEFSGPPPEEEILEEETYPYIVIKMEYTDKNVVFE